MNAPVEVFEHGCMRSFGEAIAELAYSLFQGVGEAEAKRRIPALVDALDVMARSVGTLQNASNLDDFAKVARRGFKTRAAEMGFIGAREPTTFREAFERRRLWQALKLLDETRDGGGTGVYLSRLGVDPATVKAKCGRLVLIPAGHPAIADMVGKEDRRTPYVVAEVKDFDGETTIDLVLWPLGSPDEFFAGNATGMLLGHRNVYSPSESPLRVFRNPEEWLQAECDGVVVLHNEAWRDLWRWPGFLAVENVEDARDLAQIVAHVFDPRKIIIRDAA